MTILDSQIETEKTETRTHEVSTPIKGGRGELGVATAKLTVWQLWKAANSHLSLKAFARQLVKDGNTIAQDWFANKRGVKNAARSDKNLQRIAAERQATKASKRKTGKK